MQPVVGGNAVRSINLVKGSCLVKENQHRNLLAHRFQSGVLAGLIDVGDDGGDRVADTGDPGQPSLLY